MATGTVYSPSLSESVEMYLKAVFELGREGEFVPIASVAERLGITVVSATEKIHRLEDAGLFSHEPYRGVRLSPVGRDQAGRVVRRHRLWECFLYTELGLGWAAVHDLACSLEHAVDDEVTEPLAARLGNPARCPHGNPIPGREPQTEPEPETQLDLLPEGQAARLVRIRPETAELLAFLEDRKILPGLRLMRTGQEPLDGALFFESDLGPLVIGPGVASHLVVGGLEPQLRAGSG
jgi:DtxR family transcriptional regulator, Mn-dependent transcriptional regulator